MISFRTVVGRYGDGNKKQLMVRIVIVVVLMVVDSETDVAAKR